jgi:hypothetical protein
MSDHRFQDVWKQQCEAARSIRVQHGVLSALDYLIGEKLMIYTDRAVTRPEFARELPRFVAEVRDIFSGEEIRHYLDHLARMAAIEDEQARMRTTMRAISWKTLPSNVPQSEYALRS